MTTAERQRLNLIDARDAAAELKLARGVPQLRRMAERREYPELLHVARGEYRVRLEDHEAFIAGRWTSVEKARADLQWERARELLLKGGT